MVTFLHLADVHLSGPFHAAAGALLERARAAHRTAFRRAMTYALREKVDAVLIAGDLFDAAYLDYGTEQFLAAQLARLGEAGISCFYAAGGGDPAGARSRGGAIAEQASLHCFAAPTPEAVPLEAADGRPLARVVGACSSGHSGEEPGAGRSWAAFPAREGKVPHVGLLPASLPKALRGLGYDYWALGGGHRRQQAGSGARAWHAGPLMGRRPSEAGPQGGLLVTLEEGRAPQVTFQPFAPLSWADVRLGTLQKVHGRHALLQQAQRAFEAQRKEAAEPSAGWLARFTLAGGCPMASTLHDPEEREHLEEALADHLDLEAAFLRLRHLTPPVDPARHRGEPHVLGEALALLDRAEANPALLRSLAPTVRAAGPAEAEDVPPEALEDYLRTLSEGLDREACARLLREAASAGKADAPAP